jgi:radical SAM superfamily enzyme YgiQ (UPF0313 family)
MKITFAAIGWENLAVSLLSAIAQQQGHQTCLAFSAGLFHDRYNLHIPLLANLFDDTPTVIKTIEQQDPDVLVCSCFTANYQWLLGIAKAAKRLNPRVKILFGGVHPTAIGARVFQHPQVDYVCRGEGDYAFPLILDHIQRGQPNVAIPNTIYKSQTGELIHGPQKGFTRDLDTLPIFDKRIWENHVDLSRIYFTLATRGCPYQCSYCFNSFYPYIHNDEKKHYVRQRSPDHMLKELLYAKKRYRLKIIEFEDDVFTLNKVWLKNFLAAYKKEIGLPFQCLSHPTYMEEETAKRLADAGCIFVQMGVQSMDEAYKHTYLNRPDTTADVEQALKAMKKYKIQVKVDHMFGLPKEPLNAQSDALAMYRKYPPYRVQTFWVNFMPQTTMTQQAHTNGLLSAADMENIAEGRGHDYYRASKAVRDASRQKMYKSYETLFKLIPLIPRSWIPKRLPLWLRVLPTFLLSLIGFWADAVNGLCRNNPDHRAYLRYYRYHIQKEMLTKIGISTRPATIIDADTDPGETPAASGKKESVCT